MADFYTIYLSLTPIHNTTSASVDKHKILKKHRLFPRMIYVIKFYIVNIFTIINKK